MTGRSRRCGKGALAASRKRASNEGYIADLDRSIREKAAQLGTIFQAQISELSANVAEADATAEGRRLAFDQATQLANKNVTNTNTLKPARQYHEAALSSRDAANAKLQQKISQAEGLSRGVFVGEDLTPLAELAQKRPGD